MSASSPSSPLKNPVLIAVLVVAALGVTALNVKTFGNKKPGPQRVQAAAMDGPALPPDLPLLVRELVENAKPAEVLTGPATDLEKLLKRDPFVAPGQTGSAPRARSAAPAAPAARPGSSPLACTAVLTGGTRDSARINGQFYAQGEKIRGYTVAWVASTGVTLENSAGKKFFLPLKPKSKNKQAFQVQMGRAGD